MAMARSGLVGGADRVVRGVLGLALAIYAGMASTAEGPMSTMEIAAAVVGLVLMATAAMKFCPIYKLLGICTA